MRKYKSKNQWGTFVTEFPIGTPPQYETISISEANKIKKKLKSYPGLKIYEYGKKGSGRYTIKLKVEKDGEIIQEDLTYNTKNLNLMLKKYKLARNKLFPNQLDDEEFKKLRLLKVNAILSDQQFADKLNQSKYLTNKGNNWSVDSVFNTRKRLGIN